MIPIYLHLKNVMSHKESKIDFRQLGSIIFVIGNEDGSTRKSNAAGKTTIFHGIEYIVFNAASSKKINKVIRDGATKCEGTFIFKMSDGNIYKIYRHRTERTNGVELYHKNGDAWDNLTCRKPSNTDQLILNIVGVNKVTFENTSYFKQNDLLNLANATAEKRKQIISSMLELGVWKNYRDLAKKKKDPYDTELAIINRQISELGNPATDLLASNTWYEKCKEDKVKYTSGLEDNKKKLTAKSETLTKLKSLTTDRSQVERQYNDAVLFLQESQDNLKFIQNSVTENVTESKRLFNSIEIKNKLINDKNIKITELVGKIPEPVDMNKYEAERDELAKHTVSAKENRALLKSLTKPLPLDAVCPACTTVLDSEHRKELSEAKKLRAEKVETDIANTEDLISLCEESIQFFEQKVLERNTATSHVNQLTAELTELNRDIRICESNIEKLKERLASLKEKETHAQESIEIARKSYDEIKTIKVAFMSDQNTGEVNRLAAEVAALNKENKELSSLLQDTNTELGRTSEKINQAEKRVADLSAAILKKDELEYIVRVYDAAMFAFSTKGIPFMVINSVLDSIQEETNKVLKLLRKNMQTQFVVDKEQKDGEVQDTLDMRFFVDMNEWDYTDLSGGQQGSVALALKFAMAVVSRKRCGADIRMLLLDEVDQPLDEESVDAFYEILKMWSKDMTIMVITHNRQLKEKLDNFILVSKKNGAASAAVVA